jgi:predicted tellurium resistance membrane protein TerC
MDWLVGLLTLVVLEVILGLDNVIFISILAARLPADQQKKARNWGLGLAMVMRLGLLAVVSWIMKLEGTLFTIKGHDISGKDLILIVGGLFLIYKSASEIYHKMEGEEGDKSGKIKAHSFRDILIQILLLDLVFSVDSIITAVGMVKEIWIMYTAVIITVVIMLVAAAPISGFINRHPAFKILALSFLLVIGMALMAEGLGVYIPKGYIYFSIAFALIVDLIQMRVAKKSKPVQVHEHYVEEHKPSQS